LPGERLVEPISLLGEELSTNGAVLVISNSRFPDEVSTCGLTLGCVGVQSVYIIGKVNPGGVDALLVFFVVLVVGSLVSVCSSEELELVRVLLRSYSCKDSSEPELKSMSCFVLTCSFCSVMDEGCQNLDLSYLPEVWMQRPTEVDL
jgi:hypothetical protein